MKHIKLYEEFQKSDMVQEIHKIYGGEITEEQINELINEGFFDFLKGLFMNPMKKRKLRQLAEQLVKIRVELGKLQIENEQVQELKDEFEAKTEEDPYSYSSNSRQTASRNSYSSSNSGDAAFKLKEESLRSMEDAIITNIDAIGSENETLQKYVSTVKLDSRMKSTEILIKIADSDIRRILAKSLNKDKKQVDILHKEIKGSLED